MSNITFTLENNPNLANESKLEDMVKDQVLEEKFQQLLVENWQLQSTIKEILESIKILKNQVDEVYMRTQACGCSFLRNHENSVETEIIDQYGTVVYDKLVETSDLEDSVETDQIGTPDDDDDDTVDNEEMFNQILGLNNLSSTPLIALPNCTAVQNYNDSASYSNLYLEGGSELLEKYQTSLSSMIETPTTFWFLDKRPSTPIQEPMVVDVDPNQVYQIQAYDNIEDDNDDKENQLPQRPTSLEIPSSSDKNFLEKQLRILTAPDFKIDDPWISKELIECQNILNQMREAENEELGPNSNEALLLVDEDKKVVEEKPGSGSISDYITPLQRPEVKRTRTILRRNLNLNSSLRPRPTIYQSAERQGPETRSMKKRVSFAASASLEKSVFDGGKVVGKYRQMKNKKQSRKSPTKAKLNNKRPKNSKDKPFRCSTCAKKFDHFSRFETHLRVHTAKAYTEEKPYKCTNCTKSFTLPENLAIHFRTHTAGEKSFACIKCLKKFARKSSLQKHKLTKHLLVFKFNFCKICSKYYRSKCGLSRHVQNDHNLQNVDTINLFKYTRFE